jgi:photosystem II stability/assembly factor-like uncharacterized protein
MSEKVLSGAVILFCGVILVAVNLDKIKEENLERWAERNGFEREFDEEFEEEEEEEGYDEPLKFLEFHKDIRTRDGEAAPQYEPGYKWKELEQAKANPLAMRRSQARTQGAIEWTERGPGNVPGRTRALFNIPDASNNVWLAGSATGGIWKTTDGGASWSEKNSSLTALPISSFAGTSDASTIYAGTGEYVSSIFSAIGDGIFVSTNKGDTWSQLTSTHNNPDFEIVTRLIVDPADAGTIVATTVPSNINLQAKTSAIMRSTNGGTTWTKVKEITGQFEQIIATPGNFSVQYASQNAVGVWKSTDGGITWNLSNNGMYPTGRVEIAVSPVNGNKLFASAEGKISGAESDLYVSLDAGANWSLVDVKINNTTVDFLGIDPAKDDSQGFYDNTALSDPFNENVLYFGGINLFKTTLGAIGSPTTAYSLDDAETSSFITFVNFSADAAQGRLDVGSNAGQKDVEIRFGPGITQKAHRFLVPADATSGVSDANYTYQNYVDVPFQVWDVTNNRQLMVSFRDQGRDGNFTLIEVNTSSTTATDQSREYLFVHDVDYTTTPNANIAKSGGHVYNLMYNVWPVLNAGGSFPPASKATVFIDAIPVSKYNATTINVTDAYSNYAGKNKVDQQNLQNGVHPDQHFMIPIVTDNSAKTYKILLGNDGGVFVSNSSTTPGVDDKTWTFKGLGYNTSQFYGADKKPGADVYIGGMQDNGTRVSPSSESASAISNYNYALGGDGFEVLWNSKDANKVLGTIYNGQIYSSNDAGTTWSSSVNGLSPGNTFPFITKLANSKDYPDRVFTVSSAGVHVSKDFGAHWSLTAIDENFVTNSNSLLDVDVSRANANIVWAGSGMSNQSGLERNLYVSEDGGTTFKATQNFTTVAMGSITKLATHPTEPKTAYALFSFANAPKILRTKDLGQTWQDISGFGTGDHSTNGFPNVAVYCLYVRPDNTNILWAGTEIGIVESQDNGQTWSLLLDFPKVAVWDMRGQDNQVVIATHGRGIWTATIDEPQSDLVKTSTILAAGTTPKGQLAIRIQNEENFDSLKIYAGTTLVGTIKNISVGTFDVKISNVQTGAQKISIVDYKSGGAPYASDVYAMTHISLTSVADSYQDYFLNLDKIVTSGLSLRSYSDAITGSRRSLQTPHPYVANTTYTATIKTPVRVSSTFPKAYYSDVAIVAPDDDYVVFEATKNGLDWTALPSTYNASSQASWLSTYNSGGGGLKSLLIDKEVNLSSFFSASDTLLFRWRLSSGAAQTAWGWAIDYVSIQAQPLAAESPIAPVATSAFPNPTTGTFTLRYTLRQPTDVKVQIVDMLGRTVLLKNLTDQSEGEHDSQFTLERQSPGTYLLLVTVKDYSSALKLILR